MSVNDNFLKLTNLLIFGEFLKDTICHIRFSKVSLDGKTSEMTSVNVKKQTFCCS